MSLVPLHIVKNSKVCSAAVIFLHGSGDTGQGFLNWMKFLIGDFSKPHIKFYFPTAPLQPYTPLQGELSTVWFDRYDVSPDAPEHNKTLTEVGEKVEELIKAIMKSDQLSLNRILIGGFSMGGALALHTAYRFTPGLGGVFTMSSFLNDDTIMYKEIKSLNTPLYMFHGDRDTLVPLTWGESTYKKLTDMGVQGNFNIVKNTLHELKHGELTDLFNWIEHKLPAVDH